MLKKYTHTCTLVVPNLMALCSVANTLNGGLTAAGGNYDAWTHSADGDGTYISGNGDKNPWLEFNLGAANAQT